MGSFLSSAPESVSEYGNAPDDLCGMSCDESGGKILIICQSGLAEVRFKEGGPNSRILQLTPRCCCCIRSGHWLIGFATGQVSEFDDNLELITTYIAPGGTRSHEGEVVGVFANKYIGDGLQYSSISIGSDCRLNIWSENGELLRSFASEHEFTAVCGTNTWVWATDSSHSVFSISIPSYTLTNFPLTSSATFMIPFSGVDGCFASLFDGSFAIVTTTECAATFSSQNSHKMIIAVPLHTDPNQGIITYAASDEEGTITLRVFEKNLSEVGKYRPCFALNSNEIFAIRGAEFISLSLREMARRSMRNLPELELPRKAVAKFLSSQ